MTDIAETAEVWIVDLTLSEEGVGACMSVLAADERTRAARFLRPEDRFRFIVSHAAWRLILGRELGADPRELVVEAGAKGKPELIGPWKGRLDTNLSHSGERALIGLSTIARIGVDIEVLRPVPDALRIARTHFAPSEIAALEGCDASALPHAFLGCWTRKEAVVKATGLGLFLPLDRFSVSTPPEPAAVLAVAEKVEVGSDWSLHHLDPAPGYVGAVAIAARDAPCRVRMLPVGWTNALP